MPRPPSSIEREKLERLYVRDGLSTVEIAGRLGSNRETIRKLIHRYGIPMRSKGSGMAAKWGRAVK